MNEMKLVYKPRANFIKTSPDMKMLGLKSIVGYIKPLYGPYAGTATLNISGTTALHTKDGNSCFGRLAMDDHLANTLLNVIRDSSELALEKSGDGTTSAALISALTAYNLFKMDKENPNHRPIPTLVEKGMDSVREYLEENIHRLKTTIVKDGTYDRDIARAIVNTSLDGNDRFTAVFEELYDKMEDIISTGRDADDLVFRFLEKPDSYEDSSVIFNRGYKLYQTPLVNTDAFNWSEAKVTYIQDSVDTPEDNALMFDLLNRISNHDPGKHLIIFKNISAGFKNALENTIISVQTDPNHPIHNFRFISIPTNTQDALTSISDLRVLLGDMVLEYKVEPEVNKSGPMKLPHVAAPFPLTFYSEKTPPCQITYNGNFLVISPLDPEHNKTEVTALISKLKKSMEEAESKDSIYFISPKDRLQQFQSEVAVISVTGTTAIEVERYKTQLDDAIRAFKSSIKEGVIAGGNCTVPRIILKNNLTECKARRNEFSAIYNAYCQALSALYGYDIDFNTTLTNQYPDDVKRAVEEDYPLKTLNAYTGEIDMGVLEPISTTIGVLRGAVSAAKMIYNLRMIQLMGTGDDKHLHVLSEQEELYFDK